MKRSLRFLSIFLWLGTAGLWISAVLSVEGDSRDPFVPLLSEEGKKIAANPLDPVAVVQIDPLSGLSLQGIVFDPKGVSYVILNGKLIQEKESINGVQVMKIESSKITVAVEGKEREMFVRKPQEETEGNP